MPDQKRLQMLAPAARRRAQWSVRRALASEHCSSVRVKRLFLHLAEKHHHAWFKSLDLSQVSLGSGKRVLVAGGRLDPKYLITVPNTPELPSDAP